MFNNVVEQNPLQKQLEEEEEDPLQQQLEEEEEGSIAASETSSGPSIHTAMPKAAASASSSTSTPPKARRSATHKKKTNNPQRPATTNASNKRPLPTTCLDSLPPPEKRQARFISRPTMALSARIDRAFQHRLYLIEKTHPSSSSCNFFVLGATANVYKVGLDLRPSCTCPDFLKGNTCKHILFVMLRVLRLPIDDPRVWQKALLSSELNDLVGISSLNEAVFADHQVRARFRMSQGEGGEEGKEEEFQTTVRRKVEGDCPVCYEPLGEGEEVVVFCRVCGNNVHEDCFMRWSFSKRPGTVTCIYCRAAWEERGGSRKKLKEGGYVNLAAYSDSHTPENTSLEALYPDTSMWIHHR